MRPQDVVILIKVLLEEDRNWTQVSLARELFMSQSEISESLSRSRYARLLYDRGRKVARQSFMDLLEYGIPFIFPQHPGNIVRGIPTGHSASPLKEEILSEEHYVWPYAKGYVRGQGVLPLYHSVPQAVELDKQLYEMLALIDALRVGKVREKNLALELLKKRILL
ncbi:MAG: hypothetical protein HC819_21805 [Cyclobacteriaceae bacterium]|nr:hypothetical protein [Cyclobacteriaceae bacterium]